MPDLQEHVLFGCCVVSRELVDHLPSFVDADKQAEVSTSSKHSLSRDRTIRFKGGDGMSSADEDTAEAEHSISEGKPEGDSKPAAVVAPRCYCFLSRFPFFHLHFEVLYALLARERLFNVTCLMGGVSDKDREHEKQQSATEITQILSEYRAKPVPAIGQSLSFKLPGELRSLDFSCPEGNEDMILAEWCVPILCSHVSPKTLVKVFICALLEQRIIFVCEDLGILSAALLAVIPLLFPYVWQSVFLPVLPENMAEFLQAPVPFLVGVRQLPCDVPSDCCVLYILEDRFTVPSSCSHFRLPQQKELIATLKNAFPAIDLSSSGGQKQRQYFKENELAKKVSFPYHFRSFLFD